jgi:hypothetical protein
VAEPTGERGAPAGQSAWTTAYATGPGSLDGVPFAPHAPAWSAEHALTLVGLLGRGGVGDVWEVREAHLHRTIAVKVLRADREGMRGRFLDEIRLMSSLNHPAIPPIYFTKTTTDGRPCYGMPVMLGRSLADLLRTEPKLADLLSVVARVADGAAHAHARGVVHCDLKPSNVLIGAFGEVYVADWGIARVAGAVPMPGIREGTPGYMSPGQRAGEAAAPSWDVFALGRILRDLAPVLPPAVASLAEAAEQERPGLDAAAFAAAIGDFLASREVAWHRYSVFERLTLVGRRHSGAVTVTLLATGVAAVASAVQARVSEEALFSSTLERASAAAAVDQGPVAALLALRALAIHDDPRARGLLVAGLSTPAADLVYRGGEASMCRGLAIGPDGAWVACLGVAIGDTEPPISVWGPDSPVPVRVPGTDRATAFDAWGPSLAVLVDGGTRWVFLDDPWATPRVYDLPDLGGAAVDLVAVGPQRVVVATAAGRLTLLDGEARVAEAWMDGMHVAGWLSERAGVLYTGGLGAMRAYDARTLEPIASFPGHDDVRRFTVSEHGKLASVFDDTIRVLDEGAPTWQPDVGTVLSLAWVGEDALVVGGSHGALVGRDPTTGATRWAVPQPIDHGGIFSLAGQGDLLALTAGDGRVELWRTPLESAVWTHPALVRGMHWDAALGLVTCATDGLLRAWPDTQRATREVTMGDAPRTCSVAASGLPGRVLATNSVGAVFQWEGDGLLPEAFFTGAFFTDLVGAGGRLAAGGGRFGLLVVCDDATGCQVCPPEEPDFSIIGVTRSGPWLWTSSVGGTLRQRTGCLEAYRWESQATLGKVRATEQWVAVSERGTDDVLLFDGTPSSPTARLSGHTGWPIDVAYLDPDRLVSGALDGTVRVWSLSEQKEIATIPLFAGNILDIAASPDGSQVAVSSANGRLVRRIALAGLDADPAHLEERLERTWGLTVTEGRIEPTWTGRAP